MSFSVTKTVSGVKTFPSLGGAAIKSEEETLNVVYEITSILSLSGLNGVAEYTVTPDGCNLSGTGILEFTYSGTGNPITEAETVLQESLTQGNSKEVMNCKLYISFHLR